MTTDGRLWIDLTDLLLWKERKTGVQRVVHNLVAAYSERRDDLGAFYFSQRLRTFFEVRPSAYLRAERRVEPLRQVSRWTTWARHLGPLLYEDRRRARFRAADAVLVPGGDWRRRHFLDALASLRRRRGVRVHHFVHDVMPVTEPHLFPACETDACRAYLRPAFGVVDSVLTSSRWNTGQIAGLVERGELPPVPTHAVGLGASPVTAPAAVRPAVPFQPGEFVLSVGTFEVKKNRRVLYEAYKLAAAAGTELPALVVAGQPGGLPDTAVHLLAEDPALRGRVVVLRDVPDASLAWLYQNAAYTVFGSLAEGWGLPVAESLVVGTPCLSSGTAAMPEVGQAAAGYFDPLRSGELLDLMRDAASSEGQAAHRARIAATYQPLAWADVCRAIDAAIA